MTTAPPPPGSGSRPALVGPVVRKAFVWTLAAGVLAAVAAALLSGGPAALGAAIGAGLVCAFFGFGALVLGVVATASPAASLLVALLTYTLQVVLVGMVFVALGRSGVLDKTVDAGWLGGTVIAGTLVWLVAQIVAHTRTRQPLYDLPSHGPEAGAR